MKNIQKIEPEPLCVSMKGIAQLLNISVSKVQKLRKLDSFPRPLSFNRNFRQWSKQSIVDWFKQANEQAQSKKK